MKTFFLLWRLVCYKPWLYIMIILEGIVFYMAPLVFGLILQIFFNELPVHSQFDSRLSILIGFFLLAALVRAIVSLIGTQAIVAYSFSITALLQHNLLQGILSKPGARAIPGTPGEAISNFRDDTQIIRTMLAIIVNAVALAVFVISAFVILLHVNVQLTLLVFVPLTCVIAIAQSMKKHLGRFRKASREATRRLTSAIGEILGSVQAVKIADAETHVVKYFDSINTDRRDVMLKDRVFTSALNSVFGNTVGIGTGFILVLVALSVRTKHLGPGDLALFIAYLGTIATFVQEFGVLLAQASQTAVSFEQMRNLLQGTPAENLVVHNPLRLKGAIPEVMLPSKSNADELTVLEARDLSYRYPGSGRGITTMSICLKRGSLTVITGRVASGKTTLLRLFVIYQNKNAVFQITCHAARRFQRMGLLT